MLLCKMRNIPLQILKGYAIINKKRRKFPGKVEIPMHVLTKRCLLLPLAAVMLCSAGCFGVTKTKVTIEVQNLTGVEISQLIMYCEACEMDRDNRLEGNLAVDGTAEISLGRYTESQLQEGFALEVYNAQDGSFEEFGMLMVQDGDTVSFYLDDMGLAVAVNMTPEEIDEQRRHDNEMMAAVTEPETAESAE